MGEMNPHRPYAYGVDFNLFLMFPAQAFHSPAFQPYYGFNALNKKFLFFSNVQGSIKTIF
jgi:hypothetical protein